MDKSSNQRLQVIKIKIKEDKKKEKLWLKKKCEFKSEIYKKKKIKWNWLECYLNDIIIIMWNWLVIDRRNYQRKNK